MEKGFIVFNPSEMTDEQFESLMKILEEVQKEYLKQKNSPEAD